MIINKLDLQNLQIGELVDFCFCGWVTKMESNFVPLLEIQCNDVVVEENKKVKNIISIYF